MSVTCISPAELAELARQGPVEVIDVRSPAEFQEVHCVHARNVPLHTLDPKQVMQQRSSSADQPLYVICKSGGRGQKACERFLEAGFTNVVNVTGGTTAWEQAQLPVNRGRSVMSLERQVRIAVGVMILIFTVIALTLEPLAMILVGLMGVGLIFAGVTNLCMLGELMARMPWNQGLSQTCTVAEKRS